VLGELTRGGGSRLSQQVTTKGDLIVRHLSSEVKGNTDGMFQGTADRKTGVKLVRGRSPISLSRRPNIRTEPRCSLNKFGEYLIATPTRRDTIVRQQKYAKPFITARYTLAQDYMARFFESGLDAQVIQTGIQKISGMAGMRNNDEHLQSCLDALEAFLPIAYWQFQDVVFQKMPFNAPASMQVNGVTISARPEVLVYGQDRRGNRIIGGIKLHCSKSHLLTHDAAEYVAVGLFEYLLQQKDLAGVPKSNLCAVVDVFNGSVTYAPSTYKRKLNDINAGCVEYALKWRAI
jgi:hypothetical protein